MDHNVISSIIISYLIHLYINNDNLSHSLCLIYMIVMSSLILESCSFILFESTILSMYHNNDYEVII
jgi:cytochrome c oxidase subunit IV